MAAARRSRTVAAAPAEAWAIVGDAHHLPRWWPRVTRVENVGDDGFTMVLQPPKGKPVRADFVVSASTPPTLRTWAQELAGSPFERLLASSQTAIALAPAGDGTRIEITLRQRPRGVARLGAFMVRAAARRTLDEALDALEGLLRGSSASGPAAASASSDPGRRSAPGPPAGPAG